MVVAHVEVPVKVNAWADAGVAPLVEALSSWDDIVTLDSCEAGVDALAYVQFTAEPAHALLGAAERTAAILSEMDECPAVVAVEWAFGGLQPSGRLVCPQAEVPAVAAHLLSGARRSGSSGDTERTGTRSSRACPPRQR